MGHDGNAREEQGGTVMKSARLFLYCLSKWKIAVIIAYVCVIAAVVLECVFHVPVGEEDYYISKTVLIIVCQLVVVLSVPIVSASITSSRAVKAFPMAKELYTKGLTLFTAVMCAGTALAGVGAYSIFLLVAGVEGAGAAISDTFILAAICVSPEIILLPMLMQTTLGFIAGMYLAMPDMWLLAIIASFITEDNGFGLPAWAGIAIFAGGIAVSAIIGYILSVITYKRLNFKERPTTVNGVYQK